MDENIIYIECDLIELHLKPGFTDAYFMIKGEPSEKFFCRACRLSKRKGRWILSHVYDVPGVVYYVYITAADARAITRLRQITNKFYIGGMY